MKCARCSRELTAETSVYSPWRKLRYCLPGEWKNCDRIFKKNQKAAA